MLGENGFRDPAAWKHEAAQLAMVRGPGSGGRWLRVVSPNRYFDRMVLRLGDTIAALASAPGSGGRGIVRVSGSDVKRIVSEHFAPRDPVRWEAAKRAERHPGEWRLRIDVPWDDAPFRDGLRLPVDVCWWPTSRSYTGQPLAELHLISSPPLLEAMLTQLCRSGCRPARPGEFTLRAFLAGRLDLLQAEAVLGVIDAADHAELELALRQLAGGISHQIADLRSDLLDLLAELEAGLDFVDEDIEFVSRDQLSRRIAVARQTVSELCDQASRRLHSSSRPRVVLAGLPNAGKSTLLNALCGQSAALVSDLRGTTRDYLCVPLDRDGLHIELIDTAGWNESVSGLEAVAQQRRHEQWQQADLIVWCSDLSANAESQRDDQRVFAELAGEQRPVLRIGTKADLVPETPVRRTMPFPLPRIGGEGQGEGVSAGEGVTSSVCEALSPLSLTLSPEAGARGPDSAQSPSLPQLAVSATNGLGLDELCRRIADALAVDSRGRRQWLGMTAARCQDSLLAARDALSRTADAASLGLGDDLIVIELRDALEHLGQIVGAVYTDDLLDRIFSKFCIGK